MAQIGFLLEISQNQECIVFIETLSCKNDCIIGFKPFCEPQKTPHKYFLTKDLSLKPHFYFENALTSYGKIAISKTNAIYLDDLTIWVNPHTYKILRNLFYLEDGHRETIITHVNSIVELLKL